MTQKIFDIATEVQNHINSFYDVFATKFFNVDKHRLKIKQEVIAKAVFWQGKKAYAMWIIADNGVPKDEMDVKGLAVVRSSFPKSFQVVMRKVLMDILYGEDKENIDDYILNFKKNILSNLFTEVAKVSSIKTMEKYENPTIGLTLGKYVKGTPAHYKAAINYNKLMDIYKTAGKYSKIKSGDKIKFIYLKPNNLGINELAFKGDSDPEEILEFIRDNFDAMDLYNSELEKKLKKFYTAMSWDFPSGYKKTAGKFFNF